MSKDRLASFSDCVISIVITIMVLQLHEPAGTAFADVLAVTPVFLSYLLSFVYIAIYWTNHHHLLQVVRRVNGGILWANLHLLFWLSLLPFTTAWMDEQHFATAPVFLYCLNLFLTGVAYTILQALIVRTHGPGSELHQALGRDLKGRASLVAYALAMALAFAAPILSVALTVAVALMWFIPDRRIARVIEGEGPA